MFIFVYKLGLQCFTKDVRKCYLAMFYGFIYMRSMYFEELDLFDVSPSVIPPLKLVRDPDIEFCVECVLYLCTYILRRGLCCKSSCDNSYLVPPLLCFLCNCCTKLSSVSSVNNQEIRLSISTLLKINCRLQNNVIILKVFIVV